MVKVGDIVEAALAYEEEDGLPPGEAMLSVLIDLYTGFEEPDDLRDGTLRKAWERYTRDLEIEQWQAEWRVVQEGIEVLAANLHEAGDVDLAQNLRAQEPPMLDGTPLTAAGRSPRLRVIDEVAPTLDLPDYPAWPARAPRGA
jgi:hypothetical protein